MRSKAIVAIVTTIFCQSLFISNCRAQFLKDMAQQLLPGQQQQQSQQQNLLPGLQSPIGVPTGSTSLPAGQYVLTNMSTGQGFIVLVAPNGQMYTVDPRTVQLSIQQPGQNTATNTNTLNNQQGLLPTNGKSTFGNVIKGTLNNYLQNSMSTQGQQ